MTVDITRHQTVFSPDWIKYPVNIIGVGASGSRIAMGLAKLGIPGSWIKAYDFDFVEPHNIANQIYGEDDIGRLKVEALQDAIRRATGETITIFKERVSPEKEFMFSGISFILTDTMSSRKELYEKFFKGKAFVKGYIETRMGARVGRVYNIDVMNPLHCKMYEERLYGDDEAETSLCGTSITVGPTAEMLSAFAQWQFIMRVRQINNAQHADDVMVNELIFGNAGPVMQIQFSE